MRRYYPYIYNAPSEPSDESYSVLLRWLQVNFVLFRQSGWLDRGKHENPFVVEIEMPDLMIKVQGVGLSPKEAMGIAAHKAIRLVNMTIDVAIV